MRKRAHLLELFHGPTFAFEDVALQLLGNLFEYFLVRRNEGKTGTERHHLTVVGAASADTGSAAIYGLRWKKYVSVFILYPKGRVSPVTEAQMTTILDAKVHNLAIEESCKELFADHPQINSMLKLAAVNSINWALCTNGVLLLRLLRPPEESFFQTVAEVALRGSYRKFWNILAVYFAKRMGLPVSKLVVVTDKNDIHDRFWKRGQYEKELIMGWKHKGDLLLMAQRRMRSV